MIRYCTIFFCFFFLNTYALTSNSNKKTVPVDFHLEHPDHLPHHDGHSPIKKTGQEEVVFPRKRKKGEGEGESEGE